MADSEDVQWQVVVYDEPRVAPLRAAAQYYTSESASEFFETQDVADLRFSVVVWAEWRAPLRAARQVYYQTPSSIQDERVTDATYDYVISAYQDSWKLAPSLARLYWQRVEDAADIPLELPVDLSVRGRYRPMVFRIARHLLYRSTAEDVDEPTPDAYSQSIVVGQRYRPTSFRPNPLPCSIQYGDEGIVEAEICAPRDRGPGEPTTAGLARYVDGETCDPRDTSNSDACEGR